MPLKPKFSIISPGWRCQDYVREWYKSLIKQKGPFLWTAYALDDCSDDRTHRYLRDLNDERIQVFRNTSHKGAAYSRLKLMRLCEPTSIMVMLDLDDWLNANALQVLGKAYMNRKIMATFGKYTTNKGGGANNQFYTSRDINQNTFIHKFKFQAPPLRTFRASMVEGITNEDMQDSSGRWYQTATDVALSWRFLWELQYNQIKLMPELLYVYRQRGSNSAKRFDKTRAMRDLKQKYLKRPKPEYLANA